MQSSPSRAGEGLVLSATSSPALSIGVESGHFGIHAGAGFRWVKNEQFSESNLQVGDPLDVSESVVVLSPAVTLNWLNDMSPIPWYLMIRGQRDVAVSASASGLESVSVSYSDAEHEEYLKSQNSPWVISGGLGVRTSLTERISLGGEIGVSYLTVKEKIDSESSVHELKRQSLGTFFQLTVFVYL